MPREPAALCEAALVFGSCPAAAGRRSCTDGSFTQSAVDPDKLSPACLGRAAGVLQGRLLPHPAARGVSSCPAAAGAAFPRPRPSVGPAGQRRDSGTAAGCSHRRLCAARGHNWSRLFCADTELPPRSSSGGVTLGWGLRAPQGRVPPSFPAASQAGGTCPLLAGAAGTRPVRSARGSDMLSELHQG